jgi:membrane-associated protease RseP (regulator of RpoE activity)
MSTTPGPDDRWRREADGVWVLSSQSGPYAAPLDVIDEPPPPPKPRVWRPLILFLATCATTYYAGGPWYSAALITILLTHELGHYIQARRYHVPASFPYFIPMAKPLGTMGALIVMRGRIGDRKALYDIGITGPLAGLVPTIICCVVGLQWSQVIRTGVPGEFGILGEPLIFKWLSQLVVGPLPPGRDVLLHPLAFAGWVGIFITALNLIPIGQLDGGHVLYALLRDKAHPIATFLLFGAAAAVAFNFEKYWGWSVMLMLLALMGPRHPPTGNDYVPLGPVRIVLGWLTLAFVIVGFTPVPFVQ